MSSVSCPHSPVRSVTSKVMIAVMLLIGSMLLWQGKRVSDMQTAVNIARQAERDASPRAQLIVLSAPAAIVTCDKNRKITLVNPAAEALLGWSAESLLGQNLDVLIPADLRDAQRHEMFHCLKTLQSKGGDWLLQQSSPHRRVVRSDGVEVDVEVVVRAIRYGDNYEFIAAFRQPRAEPVQNSMPLPEFNSYILQDKR